MEVKLTKPVKAQPLDDEGDPVGEPVELPAGGVYRLLGETWIKDDADDKLYAVADLKVGLY